MGRVSSNAGQGRHPAEGSHRSCDLGGDSGKNGVFGMQMSEPSWEVRREPVQEATGGFRLAPGPSSGVPSISWLLQTPSGPAAAPRGRGTAVASVWLSPIPDGRGSSDSQQRHLPRWPGQKGVGVMRGLA